MIYQLTAFYRSVLVVLGATLLLAAVDKLFGIDSDGHIWSVFGISGITVLSGLVVYFAIRKLLHSFATIGLFALLLQSIDESRNRSEKAATMYLRGTDAFAVVLCGVTIYIMKIYLVDVSAHDYKWLHAVGLVDALLVIPVPLFHFVRSTPLYSRGIAS